MRDVGSPLRPEPELVSRVQDPATGYTKTVVRCPACGKEVAGRGFNAHWRIVHAGDSAIGRRRLEERSRAERGTNPSA